MLAFAIFAVTFVLSLIALVIYLYPGSRNPSTIPGLNPVTREDGNFGDIAKAGSLHEFLVDLHKQFGPIASFWYGSIYTVSIADAKLFQEHHHAFDRPEALFLLFEDFIGPKSIQYANGKDGRARRNLYDKLLTHDACKRYFSVFQGIADDLAQKWTTLLNEEHIPLSQYMMAYALKCVLVALFGDTVSNDKEILQFRNLYDIVWGEMELRLTSPATPEREKNFKQERDKLVTIIREIVGRNESEQSYREEKFIDVLIDNTEDNDVVYCDALTYIVGGFHTTGNSRVKLAAFILKVVKEHKEKRNNKDEEKLIDSFIDHIHDDERIVSDAISYVVGGFHTTGNALSWCLYFLATHPDCQDKVYKEITSVLKEEEVDHTNIGELVYIRQVIDETFRCAVVAPWAARYQDFDSELGGHKVPKNTPVIHALGVSLVNDQVWPMPDKFDPDRFSPKHSKGRPNLAYVPFGFAGKRVCPGQRFAYIEATVALVTLLRQFKVNMVEGQVIERVHGLVTHPSDEIWITLQKR